MSKDHVARSETHLWFRDIHGDLSELVQKSRLFKKADALALTGRPRAFERRVFKKADALALTGGPGAFERRVFKKADALDF